MADPLRRKILIVEDEPTIRNVMYVLLAGAHCDSDVASSGRQALSMIRRESFDAVLLDLRCEDLKAGELVQEMKDIQPSLVGRVLVITGEVADPQALELIERNCLPHMPHSRVLEELWNRLRTLLGGSPSQNPVH